MSDELTRNACEFGAHLRFCAFCGENLHAKHAAQPFELEGLVE
jgi:hypothetical protein